MDPVRLIDLFSHWRVCGALGIAVKRSLAIMTAELRLWLGALTKSRRHRALATLTPADTASNRLNHFPKNTFYAVGEIANNP